MKLRLVTPVRGLSWYRQGLQAFWRQPLGYTGLVGLLIVLALLSATVPVVGPLLVAAAMPVAWMGFMLATRRVLLGQRITPMVMVEAVATPQMPRMAFAQLGASYVVAIQAMMLLASWLGPGDQALRDALDSNQDASLLLNNPVIVADMLWRLALTVPVSLVFWHTPALLMWARLPVPKALFFSAVAAWRNIGAFVIYGSCWLGSMLVLGVLSRVIEEVFAQPILADLLVYACGVALAAAFYASLYFSVVDCFEPPQDGEPLPSARAPGE